MEFPNINYAQTIYEITGLEFRSYLGAMKFLPEWGEEEYLELEWSGDTPTTTWDEIHTEAIRLLKLDMIDMVKERSNQIIEGAFFEFKGIFIDLSEAARSDWMGILIAANAGILTYPQAVSGKGGDRTTLDNLQETLQFFGTGLSIVASLKATGYPIIDAIEATNDLTTLMGIEDNRNDYGVTP